MDMTVTVERFDIAQVPDHGRPEVARFVGPEGRLSVHCDREDGSLWLFAHGPRGGDRGTVVFPTQQAAALRAWVTSEAHRPAPSTTGVLWMEDDATVVKADALHRREWRMVDADAATELCACLREWAEAALRAADG